MSSTASLLVADAVMGTVGTIVVDDDTVVRVNPLHRGHHPVWNSGRYHVDICNMVDDVVTCDRRTGLIYRFPIDDQLMPWLVELILAMDTHDEMSSSPWATHNLGVRTRIMEAAMNRLAGNSPKLNTFEPGAVAPAVVIDTSRPITVDEMMSMIIAERPGALVG